MKKRWIEIDAMRGVAQLAVVMIHVSSGFSLNTRAGYFLNQASRFAVPLFILLSGFGLGVRKKPASVAGYKSFFKQRLLKVLAPYVFWSFVFQLYSLVIHGWEAMQWKEIAFGFLTGKSYMHLYFLFVLAQLYLLYFWILGFYKKSKYKTIFIGFLITFLFQVAIYGSAQEWWTLPSFIFSYSTVFPTYLFFFIIGIFLRDNYERISVFTSRRLLFATLLTLLSLTLVLFDNKNQAVLAISVRPVVMPYVLSSFFFILYWYKRIPLSLLKKLGEHSYLIYLIHPLFYGLLSQVYFRKREWFSFLPNTAVLCIIYILTVILSYYISRALNRIPRAWIVGGRNQRFTNYS